MLTRPLLPAVDFLRNPRPADEEEYGCDYDCPCFPQLWDYARAVVGGTLAGARKLIYEEARTCLHFNGGRHHAKPDRADGFCYVNDICIAIFELLEGFDGPVLYIDIDVHHGDGVEQAFYSSNRVMTLSLHRHGPGYFPGSGAIDATGTGNGVGYSVNVPLRAGIGDERYLDLFRPVADAARSALGPKVVVMCCGADALSRDPLGELNLTTAGYTGAVRHVLGWKLPVLVLGGGGYHNADSARCYAAITAEVLGAPLPADVPEHDHLHHYGSDFKMCTKASPMEDLNTEESLAEVRETVLGNLRRLGGEDAEPAKPAAAAAAQAEQPVQAAAQAAQPTAQPAAKPAAQAAEPSAQPTARVEQPAAQASGASGSDAAD